MPRRCHNEDATTGSVKEIGVEFIDGTARAFPGSQVDIRQGEKVALLVVENEYGIVNAACVFDVAAVVGRQGR